MLVIYYKYNWNFLPQGLLKTLLIFRETGRAFTILHLQLPVPVLQ